jgi:hypothetical protein
MLQEPRTLRAKGVEMQVARSFEPGRLKQICKSLGAAVMVASAPASHIEKARFNANLIALGRNPKLCSPDFFYFPSFNLKNFTCCL